MVDAKVCLFRNNIPFPVEPLKKFLVDLFFQRIKFVSTNQWESLYQCDLLNGVALTAFTPIVVVVVAVVAVVVVAAAAVV